MSTPERTRHGWEVEHGVTCVVCPDCAFAFDATHEDSEGGYSCPNCSDRRTPVDVAPEGTAKCSKGASLTGWDYDYHRQHGCVEAMGAPEGTEREAIAKIVEAVQVEHGQSIRSMLPSTPATVWADRILAALRTPREPRARIFDNDIGGSSAAPPREPVASAEREAENLLRMYREAVIRHSFVVAGARTAGDVGDSGEQLDAAHAKVLAALRARPPEGEASEPVAGETSAEYLARHGDTRYIGPSSKWPPAPSSSPEDVAWMDLAKDYEVEIARLREALEMIAQYGHYSGETLAGFARRALSTTHEEEQE